MSDVSGDASKRLEIDGGISTVQNNSGPSYGIINY